MLTKDEAVNADEFHYGTCKRIEGPRGGVKIHQHVYRRNGQTQTWKTRPDEFRIPVKYGMYTYENIWHHDAAQFHTAATCPLLFTVKEPVNELSR